MSEVYDVFRSYRRSDGIGYHRQIRQAEFFRRRFDLHPLCDISVGTASAMIYSLVVSAKQNGLNVEEYLTKLLRADEPIFPY